MHNKKNISEDIKSNLKDAFGSEISKINVPSSQRTDLMMAVNQTIKSLDEDKDKKNKMIKRNIKQGVSKNLVGTSKMKTPIGKLFSIGKSETKEATGSGAAGSFEGPLFSTTKKEVEETKKKKNEKFEAPKLTMFSDEAPKEIKKKQIEEKWSKEYKKSIDCNNPKGFSQKAHCDARKKRQKGEETKSKSPFKEEKSKLKKVEGKKTETKEATGSGSAGSYVTPAAWAKSTSKKDWRGKSKTQIPGGKFVQVKKKCKTFPYCNQGDIKALKIFENEKLKKIIKTISEKHGISENVIKNIISYEYLNNKK